MNIVIILLSFILVVSSLFLILLVLVQLPKKEAGLGQAFGSSTTDALFGPGSGNMLTKMTKWTAGIFFALVILIWILQGHAVRARQVDPREKAKLTAAEKAEIEPKPAAPAAAISTNSSTNASLLLKTATNVMGLTNPSKPAAIPQTPAAAAPATPPPAPK